MAAKKLKVEFVKRYEDRDKNGEKIVIPAGTKVEMTKAEYENAGSKVRLIQQDSPDDEGETEDGDDGQGNGG